MKPKTARKDSEIKRIGRFGAVGVINTLIDFTFYNLFSRRLKFAAVAAKFLSSTIAMVVSFVLNKQSVFRNTQKDVWSQALKFLVVTGLNIWGLQLLIIYFLTKVWTGLTSLADTVAKILHLTAIFSPDFMSKNVPFVVAICAGLVWNYLFYKKVVFDS